MKSYNILIKDIKEKLIKEHILLIETYLRLLTPYDYVICKDGVPRIGTKLGTRHTSLDTKEAVKKFPEIKAHFVNNGFLIEELENDDIIIYIQDNEVIQTSNLCTDVIEKLRKYTYTECQLNWLLQANKTAKSDSNVFEYVSNDIKDIVGLNGIKKENGVKEFSIGKVCYDEEKSLSKDFLINQGFEFCDESKICEVPDKNEANNNIIEYCYETIHDRIASEIICLRRKEFLLSKLIIKGRLPEEVENALKDDGFIVKRKENNIFEISLV